MSFESDQKNYFLREMNRAVPTKITMSTDSDTLNLALGNIDPVMPDEARPGSIEINSLASDFGARTSVLSRDAACRAIPMPGNAMRAPDARTGCGWWYSPSPSASSVGAYGTRRGPMNPNLDKQVGPGEWIWDPSQAYKLESMKTADRVKTCKDLQFRSDPNIGWCASTNRAVVTNSYGRPNFPQARGGDCPDPNIIKDAKDCPVPVSSLGSMVSTTGVSDLCAPINGILGSACLQNLALQAGCNTNGLLANTLGGGYAGKSAPFNQANALIVQRGFSLHPGIVNDGRVSVQDALSSVRGLKSFANSGDGTRAASAALNLCYGTPFDPCQYNAGDSGPFDPICITQTAIGMGYSPNGGLLPGKIGQAYWDQFKTWQDAVVAMRWWKNVADLGPAYTGQNITPDLQTNGIANVYGLSVQYPTGGCNTNGLLMYRYLFPTWDNNLFPPKGPSTHFLGRYILNDGFPYYPGSNYKKQAAAGGYLTEGQRMVTKFSPKVGGTYQFLISCNDYVRLQINDQVIAQVSGGGVPTPSQTVQMQPGQVYKMVIDLWNSGSWSFSIKMSVNGGGWQDIPLKQMLMMQDRRLPSVELAFNKMSAGTRGAIKDTNNVFQNLALSSNASIGTLNGRNCLIVNGPNSCVNNHASVSQGIRVRAMKTITMMIQVNSMSAPTGVTPSVVSFYNLPNSDVNALPKPFSDPASAGEAVAPGCKGLGRPGVLNNTEVRLYNKDECNTMDGNHYTDGQCLKKAGGSYSWDCRTLNSLQATNTGALSECRSLGRSGVVNNTEVRLYNNDECNVIGGNYYPNGECIKKGGGSYSWDCRALNNGGGGASQAYKYVDRKNDLMITINKNNIYAYGINPAIFTNAPGQQVPYPTGQWFHIALVWEDDFSGYIMYVNGVAGPRQPCPGYDVKLMMEQIRIGCDSHPEGQNWTGGIAWFRAFDYRLNDDLVKRDMNDDWATLK